MKKPRLKSGLARAATCFFILLVVTTGIFYSTIQPRSAWFGRVGVENHQLITASSISYSYNWVAQNPLHYKFALFNKPDSVETDGTLSSRSLYDSYPPGAFVPLYVLDKTSQVTTHHINLAKIADLFDLFNEFLVALALGLIALVISRFYFHLPWGASSLVSLPPSFVFLLTPAAYYWFQNTYFADQAVLIYAASFILLELLASIGLERPKLNKLFRILQFIVIFWGTFTEWYFVFLIGAFVLLRFLADWLFAPKRTKQEWWAYFQTIITYYIMPASLAIATFVIWVNSLDGWSELKRQFLARSGINAIDVAHRPLSDIIWKDYLKYGFGTYSWIIVIATLILLALLTFAILKKQRRHLPVNIRMLLVVAWTLPLSTLGKLYFFRGHTPYHQFTMLLWTMPFCLLVFCIVPLLFATQTKLKIVLSRIWQFSYPAGLTFLSIIILVVSIFYARYGMGNRLYWFPPDPTSDASFIAPSDFVGHNTTYSDIVFSLAPEVLDQSPQVSIYSHKWIYTPNGDLATVMMMHTGNLRANYSTDILINDQESSLTASTLKTLTQLRAKAFADIHSGNYELIKVHKADYIKVVNL